MAAVVIISLFFLLEIKNGPARPAGPVPPCMDHISTIFIQI